MPDRGLVPELAVGSEFRETWFASVRNSRATARFLFMTAAVCFAGFFVFLALLNAFGVFTGAFGWSLPAAAYVDLLGIAFACFAVPYGFLESRETARIRRIEERLPDLLSDLASLHKAGLTLMDAVKVASKGNYGPLTPEVQMAAGQIEWGVPVLEALEMLRDRLKTPVVNRTLTVVIEAGRMGGHVEDVLGVAADVARRLSVMRRQRQQEMMLYLLIVYVASLVFLFVTISLQSVFVPRMIEAVAGASGAGGGLFGVGGVPSEGEFRGLYITAAVVSGLGNGFVGGIMGEGHLRAGFKHAAAMILVAILAFALF